MMGRVKIRLQSINKFCTARIKNHLNFFFSKCKQIFCTEETHLGSGTQNARVYTKPEVQSYGELECILNQKFKDMVSWSVN